MQAALIRQVRQRVASIFSEQVNATANSHSQDPISNYSPSVFKFVFRGDKLFVGHAKAAFFLKWHDVVEYDPIMTQTLHSSSEAPLPG